MEKSEVSPHVEQFQIYRLDRGGEIYYFSTYMCVINFTYVDTFSTYDICKIDAVLM